MRARSRQVQIGARLAVGILAAVWLWNLKVVTDKILLQESVWPIFPSVQTTNTPLKHQYVVQKERTRNVSISVNETASRNQLSMPLSESSISNSTLPPPDQRVPNFIIIGAQKSGTQALRTYLKQNPLVHMSSKLEPHFFDWGYRKALSKEENWEAYIRLLNGKRNHDCREMDCITGESTPSYLFATKQVPQRMKQICPWAKLIVVLRDPVKRAFSQCNMLIEKHEVKTSFREHFQFDRKWINKVGLVTGKAVTREEEDLAWNAYHKHRKARKMMLARGLYEIQLRKWFEYFPRERFLILKSEDLEFNRTATMARVFQFLGLDYQPLAKKKDKKVHARKYMATMSNATRKEMYDFYRPYNQRLEGLLGPEWKGIWEGPS